ncbi:SDR family NAD(P)-dependent oxidoreductase [Chloroflexota bacterium]
MGNTQRLNGKVAIVTGGGVGIGEAIALAFAAEGAEVVIAARALPRLEAVAEKIRSQGGKAIAMQIDVSDEEQVKQMVARTLDEYGRVDILVNNSGIAGPTVKLVDLELAGWNETLAIDLTGTMLCSREALKNMVERQCGNIINISSVAGTIGVAMRTPYCAAKWGVIGFTQALAKEVHKNNIRVNCIAPGMVEGERMVNVFTARAEAEGMTYDDVVAKDTAAVRARMGDVFLSADEIAGTAVFLASDESSGVTGRTLTVDKGAFL